MISNPFLINDCAVFLFFFTLAGDVALCESLKEYILTEEMLIESNFPLQHPEKPGGAALFADNKKGTTDRKQMFKGFTMKALIDGL